MHRSCSPDALSQLLQRGPLVIAQRCEVLVNSLELALGLRSHEFFSLYIPATPSIRYGGQTLHPESAAGARPLEMSSIRSSGRPSHLRTHRQQMRTEPDDRYLTLEVSLHNSRERRICKQISRDAV